MSHDNDTAKATGQVILALLRLRKAAFTYDELLAVTLKGNEGAPGGFAGVIAEFMEHGYLKVNGDLYRLTKLGKEYTDIRRGEDLGKVLVSIDERKVYGHFCKLLYGMNLGQFNMITMEQLTKLIEVLELHKDKGVLDLGCGVGRITEYISDVTRANVTGLDFAGPAIRRAQERTKSKADRLTFVLGSMNQLNLPDSSFDGIISLDTLYFSINLHDTIRAMKGILRPSGQMGIFWSQTLRNAEDDVEQLRPDNTRLATALNAVSLAFQTYDYTTAEHRHWQRTLEVLQELKPEFEAEGSTELYGNRLRETRDMLEVIGSGRMSRHLYHIHM